MLGLNSRQSNDCLLVELLANCRLGRAMSFIIINLSVVLNDSDDVCEVYSRDICFSSPQNRPKLVRNSEVLNIF